MAENTIKMGEKLVKVAVLVLLIARGACSTNVAKFKISSPLEVTYENKITKSAVTRIACLSLCNEGCRFVEYSGSGPNTGVCDLYYLKDAMFDRLKKLQIASGYIKVRTWVRKD
ncbi:hypothetical protein DPMN_063117 [Dreissena polymorpha]|uniref:Uncharacterized protein n=1 Tax=Dreissena polymorpha TaxID=45954 RepID=A0A9D4C9X0_DREPO|nr:hypothetical protein DPMN_063117 [Dreissena polymorpha]